MSAHQFRFNSQMFNSRRFHGAFVPRKPRHPLLRVALGLLGLAVVLTLVFFSVFVGLAMLAIGVLVRLWKVRGKPIAQHRDRIVDGEFHVLGKTVLPRA
jgi:hypothetical protein